MLLVLSPEGNIPACPAVAAYTGVRVESPVSVTVGEASHRMEPISLFLSDTNFVVGAPEIDLEMLRQGET